MIVIPNSVISKAIVTNHRQLNEPYLCSLSLRIDSSVSPARVIKVLQSAASESHGVVPGNTPAAYACGFADSLVTYKLYFAVESYALTPEVQSEVITRVTDALLIDGIQIGTLPTDVRIIQNEAVAGAPKVAPSAISQPSGR
jgi:small-conductance mechanosensitive channel